MWPFVARPALLYFSTLCHQRNEFRGGGMYFEYLYEFCPNNFRRDHEMYVCPRRTTGLPLVGFLLNLLCGYFRKMIRIQVSLKYDKNNVYSTWTHTYLIISRSVLLGMRNVAEKLVNKTKAHILCSRNFFFVFRKLCFYRGCQAIVDSMTHGIVWLTPKASDIRSNYVVVMFSTAKLVARTQIYVIRTLWVLFILKDVREISRMHQW